ncbi:uncharacterized protein LOC120642275 isoform X3 [Panicum virgatum]|uniref:uncharacterized protein LOC120642275 isoform X3 n=1 Tax=Panicum virgatum TaxID=38727 RepID=UPI0019D633F1|nr:uncharacterized protein LOC120642275 isoform X3 [Panicum virgatum]
MGVHGVSDRANPFEVNMNEEHARCDGTCADERRSSGNYQDESGLPDSKQKLGVDAGIKSKESDGSATGHKRCTSQEHVRERQQPIFNVTPGTSGENSSENNSDAVAANNSRCTRIKKGLDNPSMGKRKASPDNNLHSKRRRTTKIISRKIRSARGNKCGSGADYFMDQGAIIPVSKKGVTPIKCHVAERQVPPSPFELNLIPRTISISVIEKMYKKFEEEEPAALNSVWFEHDDPWTIRLTGYELWKGFVQSVPITTEIFDAIVRLLQEEDTSMYKDVAVSTDNGGTCYRHASRILR